MGAYHVRGSHLKLIAWHHAKYSIRGGTSLVFTFLTLVIGLSLAAVVITPVEYLQEELKHPERWGAFEEDEAPFGAKPAVPPGGGFAQDKPFGGKRRPQGFQRPANLTDEELTKRVVDEVAKQSRGFVKWALGADDDQADYLIHEKPALVSAILSLLLWVLPFVVTFGAFNQTAGDIQHRGLRYLLLRTERANIFFGRFLGTFIFTMIVLFLLLAVVYIYLAAKIKFYPAGEMALWLLQGYLAMAVFAIPYIALSAWMSGANDSPFVALVLAMLIVGFIPMLVMIGTMTFKGFRFAGYVLPWPLKFELLHPSILHVGGAVLAILGYTALFLWLGMRTFQKRDL